MKRIALATCAEALPLDDDMPPLLAACAAQGLDAAAVNWDDSSVNWGGYAAVLLRSTWDYVPRLHSFLLWAEAVSRQTRLFNPRELVRWSSDKHYLADLTRAGVPIVPTLFVEPGETGKSAGWPWLQCWSGASFPTTSSHNRRIQHFLPASPVW